MNDGGFSHSVSRDRDLRRPRGKDVQLTITSLPPSLSVFLSLLLDY